MPALGRSQVFRAENTVEYYDREIAKDGQQRLTFAVQHETACQQMEQRRSDSSLAPSPLTCPLCGGPNGCGPASSGNFDNTCWCEAASFSPELLSRVPLACRGSSCICAACAAAESARLETSHE